MANSDAKGASTDSICGHALRKSSKSTDAECAAKTKQSTGISRLQRERNCTNAQFFLKQSLKVS